MTNEEAIENIKDQCDIDCEGYGNSKDCDDCPSGVAVKALEKQIPKKLKAEGTMVAIDIYGNETHLWSCPNCGRDYETPNQQATPYCCWCGQAISWESEETECD